MEENFVQVISDEGLYPEHIKKNPYDPIIKDK